MWELVGNLDEECDNLFIGKHLLRSQERCQKEVYFLLLSKSIKYLDNKDGHPLL